jgi:hypothetical protein
MTAFKRFFMASLLVVCCVFALTASVPNVPSGTWQAWGNLSVARRGAATVRLQDGRVLIIGGSDANGPLSSVEIFGNDGTFSNAQAMHAARIGHIATMLSDGRVLVSGGVSSGTVTNTAEIYDPSSDSWKAVSGGMVDARAGHTASVLLDGRIFIAGGHDASGNALSSTEIFDPIIEGFIPSATMGSPRMNHAAGVLGDGRVFLIGGTDGANTLNSVDIFDPVAGTVAPGPGLSVARSSATATITLDGKLVVIGGSNESGDLASIEIFDSFVGTFALSAANLTTARSGHQAFLLPNNNSVLVVGGTSAGTDLSSADLYQPWSDATQTTGAMASARPGLNGSALNTDGLLLAFGGTSTSTELYGFPTVKTDQADYPPGTPVTITGSGWQPGETVTLTLVESPDLDTHPVLAAVADANGNIANADFAPDMHDLDVRFYLTAVGSVSGRQAQNTFTDANRQINITGFSINSPSGATDNTMNVSQPFNVHLVFNVSGGSWTNVGAVLTVPAGWSKSADLSGQTITNTNSRTFDWTVTPSASPSSGAVSVSVNGTVANPDNCNQCPATNSFNATAVNPASLSVTSMTAAKTVGGGTTAKTGDAITVTMVVANAAAPRATANSVAPSLLTVNASGATGTCSASGTSAANILAGGTRTYTYSCSVTGGNGTLTFTGSAAGTDENSLTAVNSGPATTNSITADNTAPVAPSTPDLDPASDSGTLNNDDITNVQKPKFNGTAEAGTTITLLVDGTANGTALTDGSGNWSVTAANNIADGQHSITATATDAAGNVSSPSGALSVKIDTVANPPSTPDLDPASDSGALNTDNNTNVTTPKFNGTAEANASVELFRGAISLGTTTADNSGNWSLTVASALADNTYSITAKQTDVAGNVSNASGALSLVIDTTPPNAPSSPNLSPSDDTGILNNDNITNKTTNLNLTGSADPNITVTLFEGATQLGTTTSNNGSGNWTITAPGPFSPGNHIFTAKATDTAGNPSSLSAPHTVFIDTTAPTVTINQAAGQADPAVAGPINFTVVFSESTTNFATGDVTLSGTAGATTALVTGSGTTYNVSVSGMTTPGTVIASIAAGVATDTAGNGNTASTSTDNTVTYNPDSKPPVVTISFAAPDGQNGWFVHSPVAGTVSANDTTTGNSNVTAISCTDGANPLAVSSPSGIGTPSASGSISVAGDGTHNIACTATDSAGNTGAFTGSTVMPVAVKIDTQAPTGVVGTAARVADHNGWYNASVGITFNGTDSTSGIASCTTTTYSGPDSATASVLGHCTDNAGNASADVPFNFKFDATAPTGVSLTITGGTAGANGWYTSDVTVHTSGTESVSGPPVCTADQIQTAETTSQSFNGSCTNDAGLSANAAPLTIKLDKTPPSATLAVFAGTLGNNGWYVSDVTVRTSGTDSISSPVSCSADQFQTTDTTGQTFHGSCTNDAGLSANATDLNVKLDKTAPTVQITPSRLADHNGWYNHALSFTNPGTDSTSGIASCTTPAAYSGPDNASASVNATCTDKAGNVGNGSFNFQYDSTPPSNVTGSPNRTADHNGWYNHAVDVVFSGTDATSGIEACTNTSYSGPDSVSASANGHCTDNAGNSSTDVASSAFKFDSTPPTAVSAVSVGTPGTNGWYTSNVTVHTAGTDSVSNPVTCDADQVFSTETTGTLVSGNCTNDAGLSAVSTAITVKLDKTPPTASLTVFAGTLGDHGWYVSDVTIRTSGTDSISSPVSCTADQFQTTDTTGQTFHGSCTNDAGLSANATDLNVKLDKTAPTVQITPSRLADHNGWYNHALTFTNPGADSTSGIASCTTPAGYSAPDNANASVNATCTDNAGNVGNGSFNFQYDSTPPTNVAGAPNRAPDHNSWYNHAVDVVFSGTDATSGIEACTNTSYSGPDSLTASASGHCTDNAGNSSADISSSAFKFDSTPPTAVSAVSAGTPGTNGWYTSNVTVHTTGTDNISNPVTCDADQVISAETAGTLVSGNCTNDAGLSAVSTAITVKLDKTPPTNVTLTPTGTLGLNSWYTSDVTIKTTGQDSISTPVVCSADQSQTTDTTGQTFHGSCTNDAGLSANATDLTIKRDATPPVLTVTFTPDAPDGNNGWWRTAGGVPYNWACNDATSGVDSSFNGGCPTAASGTTTANGTTHFNGQVRDQAGNLSVMVSRDLKLDNVAPVVTWNSAGDTCSLTGNSGWCRGTETAAFTASDATSGLASPAQASFTQSTGTNGASILIASGSVTDQAGNTNSGVNAGPYKIDSVAPTITLNNPTNGSNYLLNAAIPASYSCNDSTSGVSSCAGPVANGSNFSTNPVGGHSFTVNATDVAGNPATPVTYNYSVLYASGGMCLGSPGHTILQPINSDGTSVFKLGSTVPTKFRVCDANGVSIGSSDVVAGYGLIAAANTPNITVAEDIYSTTPDTAFRWDATDQQWIFNQSTKNNSTMNAKGVTYFLAIKLGDGSFIYFQYGLK